LQRLHVIAGTHRARAHFVSVMMRCERIRDTACKYANAQKEQRYRKQCAGAHFDAVKPLAGGTRRTD